MIYIYKNYTLIIHPKEIVIMLTKYRLNVSVFTAFAVALLLLATDVFAGNYGKKESDIVDTVILPN